MFSHNLRKRTTENRNVPPNLYYVFEVFCSYIWTIGYVSGYFGIIVYLILFNYFSKNTIRLCYLLHFFMHHIHSVRCFSFVNCINALPMHSKKFLIEFWRSNGICFHLKYKKFCQSFWLARNGRLFLNASEVSRPFERLSNKWVKNEKCDSSAFPLHSLKSVFF